MSRHIMLVSVLTLLAGCAAQSVPHASSAPAASAETRAPQRITQGRYTRVSTEPLPEQHDLLAQLIDMRIPASLNPTVGEALRHLLQRTGYSLCAETGETPTLYGHALPAAHYQLGPLPLKQALQLLGGPAWQLSVDDTERRVCFELRAELDSHYPPSPSLMPGDRP
jgi:conjugative transfer region protein (TIGR03748 family)